MVGDTDGDMMGSEAVGDCDGEVEGPEMDGEAVGSEVVGDINGVMVGSAVVDNISLGDCALGMASSCGSCGGCVCGGDRGCCVSATCGEMEYSGYRTLMPLWRQSVGRS